MLSLLPSFCREILQVHWDRAMLLAGGGNSDKLADVTTWKSRSNESRGVAAGDAGVGDWPERLMIATWSKLWANNSFRSICRGMAPEHSARMRSFLSAIFARCSGVKTGGPRKETITSFSDCFFKISKKPAGGTRT